jgi:type I restriction-modification system DNA methylase subunit
MNLAVHGLEGDIRQANSYYEDLHDAIGKFDFVLANPPFNVNAIDKERSKATSAGAEGFRSASHVRTMGTTSGLNCSTRPSTNAAEQGL